jgi:hypothetical protein
MRWQPTFFLIFVIFWLAACGPGVPGDEYTLGDRVWEDRNGDGQQDADEPGVAEVTVRLHGYFADELPEDARVIGETKTDAEGRYRFDIPPGTYRLEFMLPSGYSFTQQDAGSGDENDSDPDPSNGQTATFEFNSESSNWDAGLLKASAATEPPPEEPTVTPDGTATMSALMASYTDEVDDTVICENTTLAHDPEVDITQVTILPLPDSIQVSVYLQEPLVSDWSFAILIYFIRDQAAQAYLWELHNLVLRIGALDLNTGSVITPPAGTQINHDREVGMVDMQIPREAFADLDFNRLLVQSFHTGEEGQDKNCDLVDLMGLNLFTR